MADWTDGPEYAPSERPDSFEASGAPTLVADDRPAALPDAPAERPEFGTPPASVALADVGPRAEETRDPTTPFAVVTTPLTAVPAPGAPLGSPAVPAAAASGSTTGVYVAPAGSTTGQAPQAQWAPPVGLPVSAPQASAWGAAHSSSSNPRGPGAWAPQQPLALPDAPPVNLPPATGWPASPQVNPSAFPSPDPQPWAAAPTGQRPPTPQAPVTTLAILEAADPLTLACLAAGGLLPFATLDWAAPPLLATAFVLAVIRGRYRRQQVRNLFTTVSLSAVVFAAFGTADAYAPDLASFWSSLTGWAQLCCWILLPALLWTAGSALRRGERPEQP